jgi:hypothetical protein
LKATIPLVVAAGQGNDCRAFAGIGTSDPKADAVQQIIQGFRNAPLLVQVSDRFSGILIDEAGDLTADHQSHFLDDRAYAS